VEHGDSLGNRGVIYPGDVQWMTAGSGIIHQELPQGDEQGRMGGFQLWANLPSAQKMRAPRYRGVTAAEIPEVALASGAAVKVISGTVEGVTGPVQDVVTAPEYLDVSLPPGATFEHEVPAGHTVVAYLVAGAAYFDECREPHAHEVRSNRYFDMEAPGMVGEGHLVLYERKGERLAVTTKDSPVRFLLATGRPLGEPVAWRGPIVMNTREELEQAFSEYATGTFIKSS
jgi:redox-sensitive bicupin YhaK (pirin superfamily)